MGKRSKQLTFMEFGEQFMQHAVTPAIIRESPGTIVPEQQRMLISSPVPITIHARTVIEDVIQQPGVGTGDELAFEVPLAIHLALSIDMVVGQEQYLALARTRLRLAARVYTPLMLKIDCLLVAPDQIAVASEGQGNWLDLVKRFGLLDTAIRTQVADITNQHIQRSQSHRRIDLRKLITAAATSKIGGAPRSSAAKSRSQRRQPKPVMAEKQ